MKLTKKQIDIIIKNTPEELKGTYASGWDRLGYFQPAGANWSYVVEYVPYDFHMVLVVKMFGTIQ